MYLCKEQRAECLAVQLYAEHSNLCVSATYVMMSECMKIFLNNLESVMNHLYEQKTRDYVLVRRRIYGI